MNTLLWIGFSLSKKYTYLQKKEVFELEEPLTSKEVRLYGLLDGLELKEAQRVLQRMKALKGWCHILGFSGYPRLLSKIPYPPLVLYGLGSPVVDENHTLAWVGTRTPTAYGHRIARMLAKDLVEEGIILVSGLARGIDSIAHMAAVHQKQPTVAVLACGVDRVYPPEHRRLAQQVVEHGGTIVSEFPPGTSALRAYFHQRNRLISGLCKALLVIEAGQKSGTRITVNHALDQGREVFAVPGPIDSEYSLFTNELICTGAHMVRSTSDIYPLFPNRKPLQKPQVLASTCTQQDPLKLALLEFFEEPHFAESFQVKYGVSSALLLQNLTELEIEGKIQKLPNSMYIRLSPSK